MSLTPKEKRIRQKLRNDFEAYASKCLRIRTKSGKIAPLKLNRAQKHIHAELTDQLNTTGKIRALILKGRQQGVSTYTEGRYYWRTTHNRGTRAFILTHEQQATDNLFEMSQRFHEHCPSLMKPQTETASAKELLFGVMDSGYKVGTAGSKGVGRSSTIQYFHGSEVAFWPNAETHAVGVMQAIPDAEGTEVIQESTANGLGNYFHEQWKLAESGHSDYIAIFIPWYWQEEYRKTPPTDFTKSPEEEKLALQYKLDDSQLAWRRNKILELSTGAIDGNVQFKQEYPMTAAEAFQMSGIEALISPDVIMRARKADVIPIGPKIVGIDPSYGKDRFAIVCRQGSKIYHHEGHVGAAVETLQKRAAKCIRVLEEEQPDMTFVDSGAGADLVDYLHDKGYENVRAISFGSTPNREDRYINKRAEMIGDLAEWLTDENVVTQIPDCDEFHADLAASPYDVDVHRRLKIKEKKLIKKEFGFSPDFLDAAALTFAEPVTARQVVTSHEYYPQKSHGWMS